MKKNSNIDFICDFTEIEKSIKIDIQNGEIPSLCIAVCKNGQIIYEKAYGFSDVENKIKTTLETPYQLASASKPMTATGILLLEKEKNIDIHDSIEKYIQPLKFKVYEGNSSNVRIIDVLSHNSGLGTFMDIHYSDESVHFKPFEEIFDKYGCLFHSSGLKNEYSNIGYGLLDYLIKKQSGMPFSQFMKQKLFLPLDMKNSFVDDFKSDNDYVAKKYTNHLELLPKVKNNTLGAGNIYSSIHDLALFSMFSLGEYKKELIDTKKLKLMQNYYNHNALYHYYDSTKYGLGWYFKIDDNGYKVVWHEGGMMGASSMIKLIPEENISIVVLCNVFNQQYVQTITNKIGKVILPKYEPSPLNEVANYNHFTTDPSYFGEWKGSIIVDDKSILCTLFIKENGELIIEYLDFTY